MISQALAVASDFNHNKEKITTAETVIFTNELTNFLIAGLDRYSEQRVHNFALTRAKAF